MEEMTTKILLVGASGALGGHTPSELVSRGADVRAPVGASSGMVLKASSDPRGVSDDSGPVLA